MTATASRPKLLITRQLPAPVEARATQLFDVERNETNGLWDQRTLLARAEGKDALLVTVTDRLDAATIAALPPSIRMIATFSVGHDHIDMAAANARGLPVSNTPDVLTDATAEIAILLMLGAARGATTGTAAIREGTWSNWAPTGMLGIQVTGKRLGILGLGRIGQAVARRARAFDMEIHYHNRKQLPPAQEAGAIYHSAPEALFAVSDVLSIHCASTAETRGLVNAARLALLPTDAVLVNTARGDIVVDEDLIAALKKEQPAAAGLDVFNGEPNIHPGYKDLPNAFLLPHLGSATHATREAMGMRALDNLEAFFAGRPLPDPIITN
ncbi:MAG: D-glycerate dehydrogenase [Rhizobiales bacterium]|nr:D-glycerate dehydrogenase [Hyphomicrobiales bacterium]